MESNTRERIIEHAAWQYLNNGIKNITMDEIAEQLGMSKRTIYELFHDKKELVMECLNFFTQMNNAKRKEIFQSAENSFAALLCLYKANKEEIIKVNQKFINDLKKYFPEISKSHEASKQRMKEKLVEIFSEAMNEGYVLNTLNASILGHLFAEELTTVFEKDFHNQSSFNLSDVYETMCLTFFRGIATEKGREMINKYL